MALRNADCSVTCVVARRDPGVVNLFDTGGLGPVQLPVRWQGMDRVPTMSGGLVKLADLAPRCRD